MRDMVRGRAKSHGRRADPRVPLEETEQTIFFNRLRFLYPHLAQKVFAIPNGGLRSKTEAARMKLAGVVPGVPDIFAAITRPSPPGECPGLFIEMKRVKGSKTSAAQREVQAELEAEGYQVEIAHGAEQAFEIFEKYVKGAANG